MSKNLRFIQQDYFIFLDTLLISISGTTENVQKKPSNQDLGIGFILDEVRFHYSYRGQNDWICKK